MLKLRSNIIIYGVILSIFILCVATFAEARGRGGGDRSISRSGPASRGSFSSGSNRTRQSTSQANRSRQVKSAQENRGAHIGTAQGNLRDKSRENKRLDEGDREEAKEKWQEERKERQDDRQEAIKEFQDDRQDFIDDQRDDYWDDYHYGGTSVVYITSLPCTSSAVVVNGITYYNCSATWYRRGYSGSQVTYSIVDALPGY